MFFSLQLLPKQEASVHLLGYVMVSVLIVGQLISISTAIRIMPHIEVCKGFAKFQVLSISGNFITHYFLLEKLVRK
jgi:hypothetical protein